MTADTKLRSLRIADAARALRHVFIRNLALDAMIGIHGHEIDVAQPIRINVDLAVEDAVTRGDIIENVVDYEIVAGKIRALIARGHINLVETLAERIAALCLDDPRVKSARVRVEKLRAIKGAEAAGVEIERTQP